MATVISLIPAFLFGLGLYWIGLQMQKELDRRKKNKHLS